MFDSYKSPIQSEIMKHRTEVNAQLRRLQETMDTLVYWETLYNKENKINKNANGLKNLIIINDILHEKTPECYFIEQPEMQGVLKHKEREKTQILPIVAPTVDLLASMPNLDSVKTEIFLLRNDMPGSAQRTIMKIENNGNFEFVMRTKHKNIEEERILDAKEYLMLTMHINTETPRISTTKYTFIHKKRKYSILVNNTENTAVLEMFKSAQIPDFIKLKPEND